MQTFLPFKDFTKSAQALDNKRLNKQILEGYQILKVLGNPDPKAAWRNHPAVKMWRGSEHILYVYVEAMVTEANKRGIKTDKNVANLEALYDEHAGDWGLLFPAWYNDDIRMARITTTHKFNLYRKDPIYYYDFHFASRNRNNLPCCDKCQYYWPTHNVA
jgi:hypothetical protein